MTFSEDFRPMQNIKFIILFFFCAFGAQSQSLHTPSEIQNIVKNSIRTYVFDTLTVLPAPSPPIIINKILDFSISQKNNFVDLSGYRLRKKAKKSLKKANNYFSAGKYSKAFDLYRSLYEATKASKMLPLLAHCANLANNTEVSLDYYNKLLLLSPKKSDILFEIANIQHKAGNINLAFRNINLAHLYDRNNPVILDSLISIYRSKGFVYQNINFEPKYQLYETADSNVVIKSADVPWKSYATCKAVWAHEPNYKFKMKFISTADVGIVEEKECLLNALLSFERLTEGKSNYPMLEILSSVLPEKRIDDFILYEMTSKKHPVIVERLSDMRIEQLIDYIMTYRVTVQVN